MFHFMKKDKDDKKKDKDKDKDKKKDKKERRITLEELRRLEEARRSLVGKTKKKEKLPSGITADYLESFTQAEREALASRGAVSVLAGSSSATDAGVPPRPPKRGSGSVVSLKGSLQDYQLVADNIETPAGTTESTVRNEVLNYERLLQRRASGAAGPSAPPPLPNRPPPAASPSQSTHSTPSSSSVQRLARQFDTPRRSPTLSPSGSVRSSASSATTLSEPRAGEASGGRAPHRFPGHELRLPALATAPPPPARILRVARQPGGDFGFALRRSIVLERTARGESRKTVIFAEPGRSSTGEPGGTGLLPGDRLVEVNGVNVEDADREKVVALIRSSADTVVLKVQPIPEVSELSQRRAVDGSHLAVPEDGLNAIRRDGTLRRTGSLRFANKVGQGHGHGRRQGRQQVSCQLSGVTILAADDTDCRQYRCQLTDSGSGDRSDIYVEWWRHRALIAGYDHGSHKVIRGDKKVIRPARGAAPAPAPLHPARPAMLGTFESSLRRSDRSRGSVRGRGRTVSPRPGSSTTDAGLHYLSGSPTPSVASTRPSSGLSDRMPPGSVSSASSVSSVTNRLYHSSTLASAAKTRPAPPERPPERPLRRTNLVELASKVVKTSDFQEGPRVSQLITLEISDEDERAHSGGTVMRRRRSLPNITPAPTAEQPGTPRSGRRRATAGARPRAAESPAGTDPPYGGSLDRRRVARKDGYQRRLGSDGSSASSSPARSDSPTPPGSPAPTGRRRAHCHSQPRPTRDKTPPPFELTLRRSVSVPAKSMGKCDGKSANRSASARKPLTKTQSAGGGGRSGEGLTDESTPLSRTASDSRVEQLLREARKAREMGLAEPRRALIYFPVRSMKKQNGKSFKDLTRILEEHHVDTTDTLSPGRAAVDYPHSGPGPAASSGSSSGSGRGSGSGSCSCSGYGSGEIAGRSAAPMSPLAVLAGVAGTPIIRLPLLCTG
ncbi:Unconventional myosin-XVIIIa [Amphibalanus amphitrite]|uniref:Unconventional myosin-XVIIIa n=1 Tax=Amphibalanus amphitrite TaxID=1232801 RepID=A0A6A4W445_AMPAM|nr:Unconventional myosin-XVIIIa [Amphibalanus amphitrite]